MNSVASVPAHFPSLSDQLKPEAKEELKFRMERPEDFLSPLGAATVAVGASSCVVRVPQQHACRAASGYSRPIGACTTHADERATRTPTVVP